MGRHLGHLGSIDHRQKNDHSRRYVGLNTYLSINIPEQLYERLARFVGSGIRCAPGKAGLDVL